jgi:DNA replication and repair protein RecF
VIYLPSFDLRGATLASELKDQFADEIESVRQEEEARGRTMVGPQRDDLRLSVNGQDSRSFASQGQQRTIALALKLAEGRLIEELAGEAPLLLLDDVLSDLDDLRRSKLFEHVAHCGSQTFLTCPNLGPIPHQMLENASIWTVENGQIVDSQSSGLQV